jgi:outer membrane protein assembly factor BamB
MKRAAALLLLVLGTTARAENWPEFRGPTGQGHYAGKGLPTEWGTTKNVAWKKAVPGHGWSSPIIQDGRVYLTTAVPVEGSKDHALCALALDAKTGETLWQTEVFLQDGKKAPRVHSKNSHASPSPLTDGKRLYVHFGHQGPPPSTSPAKCCGATPSCATPRSTATAARRSSWTTGSSSPSTAATSS